MCCNREDAGCTARSTCAEQSARHHRVDVQRGRGTRQRLGHLTHQCLGLEIPLDQGQRRVRGVKRHEPLAIFDHDTFSVQKTSRVVLVGAVTHKEWQARFPRALLPLFALFSTRGLGWLPAAGGCCPSPQTQACPQGSRGDGRLRRVCSREKVVCISYTRRR